MGFLQGFPPGFLDDFDFTGGPVQPPYQPPAPAPQPPVYSGGGGEGGAGGPVFPPMWSGPVQPPYQPPAPPVNSGGPIFDFIGEPVGLPPGFGGPVLSPGGIIGSGVGDITQGGISGNGPDGATGGSGGVGGAPTGGGNVIYNPGPGVSGVYGDPGIGTGGFAPIIGVPFDGGNDLVNLPDDWEDRLYEIINGGGIGGIFDPIGGGPGQLPPGIFGPILPPNGNQSGGGEGGAGGPVFPPGSIFNPNPGQTPNPQPDPQPDPQPGTNLDNPIGEQPIIDEGDDSVDQDLLDRILGIFGGGGINPGEGGDAVNIIDLLTEIANTINTDVDTDIDNTVDTDIDNTVNSDIDNTTNTDVNTDTDINNDIDNTSEGGSATSTTDVSNQIDNTSAGGAGGAGGDANATGGAGGNAQGGTGGVGQGGDSSNTLTDLLSNVGNTVLNTGVSNYVADQQSKANKDAIAFSQGIYDDQVDRLEPFRQVGIDAIPGATAALNNKPEVLDLFDGQQTINPNTDVQGPTAGQVDVNKIDVFDRNSDALRFLQDEQMQAVNNGFASSGKLNSGGRYKALQDRAANVASTYAGQMQGINTAQDRANLLSDSQSFGQDATSSGFDLNQAQGNIANNFGLNSQLFNNNMAANNFYQNANSQDFNQFLNMLQLGGNAAAGQGSGMSKTQDIGATLIEDLGDIKTARSSGYLNGIKGLFS